MNLEQFTNFRASLGLSDNDSITIRANGICVSIEGIVNVDVKWDGDVTISNNVGRMGLEHLNSYDRVIAFVRGLELPQKVLT